MSIERWNPLAGPSRRELSERLDDLEAEIGTLQRVVAASAKDKNAPAPKKRG